MSIKDTPVLGICVSTLNPLQAYMHVICTLAHKVKDDNFEIITNIVRLESVCLYM
jgi:hypothetical protein